MLVPYQALILYILKTLTQMPKFLLARMKNGQIDGRISRKRPVLFRTIHESFPTFVSKFKQLLHVGAVVPEKYLVEKHAHAHTDREREREDKRNTNTMYAGRGGGGRGYNKMSYFCQAIKTFHLV